MEKLNEIELIKLEALGCINDSDSKNLHLMMETDKKFPWSEYAEYQNLVALLPSQLTIESPSSQIKYDILSKLKAPDFNFGEDDEFVSVNFEEEKSGNALFENQSQTRFPDRILSSTSAMLLKDLNSFQEVKTKKHLNFEERVQSNSVKDKLEKKLNKKIHKRNKSTSKRFGIPLGSFRAHAFASTVLLLATVTVLLYYFTSNTKETTETKQNVFIVSEITPALLEATVPDSQIQIISLESTSNLTSTEIESEEKFEFSESEQIILPKAPPELPEPIDAPLVELTTNYIAESSAIEEEILSPPPKQIEEVEEEPTDFVAVEEMPEPVGGLQEIQNKIKYPEIAQRVGIEGKVFVRAFVDETGTVTSAEIVKGIGGGCDEAAMDAILSTKFHPGKQRGKPIKVQVTVPIIFKH